MRKEPSLYERLREVLTTPDDDADIPEGHGDRNVDSWASGEISAERAASMVKYMHSHSAAAAIGVAQSGLFASARRLLDVGGCSGVFSIELAARHPDLSCTVMDLPAVCALTPAYAAERGLASRVDTYSADMFREPWPSGYDAVFFSHIFHDWRPATCLALARRAFAVLPSGGTINLHEMLLSDDAAGPRTVAAFSVLMAIGAQGQQFTFTQLESLLAQAGFTDIECHATSPLHSIVRGHKP
jgi:cyclopropane fatty-acyl-phospholipid synthase-like methyltransferase